MQSERLCYGPLKEEDPSPPKMPDRNEKSSMRLYKPFTPTTKATPRDGSEEVDQNNKKQQQEEDRKASIKSEKKVKAQTIVIGLFYGLVSGLFFAACAASVKYLDDLDPGQVAFYQYIAITVLALPMVVKGGLNVFGPDSNTKFWFLLCGIFDAVTVYLSFVSFRHLPLSDATVITSSIPVFVTVAARVFLKERCGSCQVVAIAISVAGVALVSKVPLLMASRSEDIYTRESVIGLLAALGSMASESGVYLVLRKLHDVDPYIILFNFGIVATVVNALLTVAFGGFGWTLCGVQQWLVLAVGGFSFLSQLALTKALEMEDAGPVSVLMAAGDIILAFVLDMTLFQDAPDVYTVAGTVLVVSSVMLVGFKKWIDGNVNKSSIKLKFMKILF